MTRLALMVLFIPFAAAASAPVQPVGPSLDSQLQQARAEQVAAEKETERLEAIASQARSDAEQLRARQAAAAQAIEAAEARITAADTNLRLMSVASEVRRAQLVREQQPVASLLSGLAMMARRPPLLAIADGGSADDLVRVQLLLDTTMPVIRARTALLSVQLADSRRLEASARSARAEAEQSRQTLLARRQQFAALEAQAARASLAARGQALASGDIALAAGENVIGLRSAEARNRAARTIASELAAADTAPPRPGSGSAAVSAPLSYVLPLNAPLMEGLGSVDANGVRSRGVVLASGRGAAVVTPASGVIRFSGPFRNHDGVVIIDHGRGWASLLVGVVSPLHAGDRVKLGQPLGRTLGPIEVQLSQNGRRISPAIIAGSSRPLSNKDKSG